MASIEDINRSIDILERLAEEHEDGARLDPILDRLYDELEAMERRLNRRERRRSRVA